MNWRLRILTFRNWYICLLKKKRWNGGCSLTCRYLCIRCHCFCDNVKTEAVFCPLCSFSSVVSHSQFICWYPPSACAAVWWDPRRLEKWAKECPLQFIQGLWKLHTWRGITPPHQYRLETYWLESSFAERQLWALVKTKLTMSQQRALAVKAARQPRGLH